MKVIKISERRYGPVIKMGMIYIARNIANQDEIKEFIDRLSLRTDVDNVKQWLRSNVRNWLINKYDNVDRIYDVADTDPDWLQKAIDRGDEVYKIQLDSVLEQQLEHALPWVSEQRDPSRVSVEQAIKGGEQRQVIIREKAVDVEGKIETIYDFNDGWKMVSLLDAQALSREGKIMQNCVGDEVQGYIKGVIDGDLNIFSLRDGSNNPHATIEFRSGSVQQIKGKANSFIKRGYVEYIKEFLQNYDGITEVNESEYKNIGLVMINDELMDVYNLPDDLQVGGDLNLGRTQIQTLPDGLQVGGSLDLFGTQIVSLPADLQVGGSLDLFGTQIVSLPADLQVGGNLNLSGTPIQSLPDNLQVGGNLNLYLTKIKTLPDDLQVGGHLDLGRTPIQSLPDDLQVGGDLNLGRTQIQTLPDGLQVGGNLNLSGTKIKTLPDDLQVGGHLDLFGTQIKSLPDGLQVGGSLYLWRSSIKTLPDNLSVGGHLDLGGTQIQSLPDGLQVGGNLNLWRSSIKTLPADLQVGGHLDLSGTQIQSLPADLQVGGRIIR